MKSSERSFARRIDLTSLQLFVAVCELGSIGRAAERETDTLDKMQARIDYDLDYLRNWTLKLDLHIIFTLILFQYTVDCINEIFSRVESRYHYRP